MKRLLLICGFLAGFLGVPLVGHSDAINPTVLAKAGVPTVKCPKFVMHLGSGLATALLPKSTVCLNVPRSRLGAVKKLTTKIDFPLDGSADLGTPFPEVIGQEGDVQTAPFRIGHYPAINYFEIEQFDAQSTFFFGVRDAETGETLSESNRTQGSDFTVDSSLTGVIYLFSRGSYYLKFETNNRDIQPAYTVLPGFMDPYEGFSITQGDLKFARVKVTSCPKFVLDLRTGNMAKIGGKYSCSKSSRTNIEDAGFTIAPYSLAAGMFLAMEVDEYVQSDGISLPFRVIEPAPLEYSVDDPSDKQTGRTAFNLVNLATGKAERLADIKGSISGSTTFINVPGEYYISVSTSPSEAKEYGDIGWSVSVGGQ